MSQVIDWAGLFTVAAFVVYIEVFRWARRQKSDLHEWHHCVVLVLATLFWWLGEALAIRFGKYEYSARFMMFPFSGHPDPAHLDIQHDFLQRHLASFIRLLAKPLPDGLPPPKFFIDGCKSLGQTRWEIAVPVVLFESALMFTMLNLAYQRFVEPKNATWRQKNLYLPAITGAFCGLLMVNLTAVLDPVVSTKEWCGQVADPSLTNGLSGLDIGLWYWFTNENNPGYWFSVPLGNYVAWFAATFVFTAFHRLDGPGVRGFLRWFEAKYWFRYVPGMIGALAVMTLVGTTLYFYLGLFVGRGYEFLERFGIHVGQQVWQFSAMGLVLAIAGISVAVRGSHYRHDYRHWKYTGLFWLPQFSIFILCFAAILFNLKLLVVSLLGVTVGIAIAVRRWEERSASEARQKMPTRPKAPAEVLGT